MLGYLLNFVYTFFILIVTAFVVKMATNNKHMSNSLYAFIKRQLKNFCKLVFMNQKQNKLFPN